MMTDSFMGDGPVLSAKDTENKQSQPRALRSYILYLCCYKASLVETLISLQHVTAGYEGKAVIREVNLDVLPDDFIGVIGPNGGGKTTLLKVMLGLIRPFKGKVTYSPALQGEKQFKIGYLPQWIQHDSRYPASVMDVVLTGVPTQSFGRYGKMARLAAMEALEKTGVADLTRKPFGELSGGQRQKVLLARALATRPLVLILDEPDTFTDQQFERDLYPMLREFNKNMAIVMVSHDLGIIASYVKTIACVNGGLHHHPSNMIDEKVLASYECPIDIITHGDLPHRVLNRHD